jgi:hypothetical protein
MERRRLAVVLAGVVLVGGAVVALRLTGGTPDPTATPLPPPLPTVVKPFSAQGVIAPTPGAKPPAPARLVLTPGPHRLQVAWGSALPGGHDPQGAVGYDVSWGAGDSPDHDRLVAEPVTELDGLAPGQDTHVEVRSIDSFGQRSAPATVTGRAVGDAPAAEDDALVDHFDGPGAPDPRSWRLAGSSQCAQASRGSGDDDRRMEIIGECGHSSVTLRSRAPFRLDPSAAATTGELGRVTVDTDAPGETGELDIDLVPGPVDLLDGSPNDPVLANPTNTAVVDNYLPPGTVRVRIGASVDDGTNQPSDLVQVVVGPGTPFVPPVGTVANAIPQPRDGLSVRWDVVLRKDGIRVLRDGVDVGGGNAVPKWTSATALLEFTGQAAGQLHAGVSLIGFGGAPTTAPALVAGPTLRDSTSVAVVPGSAKGAVAGSPTEPGSGQLRLTAVVAPVSATSVLTVHGVTPTFQVLIGSHVLAAVPAVAGTRLLPQVRYPLVATIPPDVLAQAMAGPSRTLPIALTMDAPANYPAQVELMQSDLEVTPGPATRAATTAGPGGTATALTPVPPQLAVLSTRVLDASGLPVPPGRPLPRGRAVLDVTLDGLAAQRATSTRQVVGLAGFEVWLDGTELVAVPTAADGPGIGGDWQVAFDPGRLTNGRHTIDIRGFATQHSTSFAETFTSFQLGS